MIDLAREIPIPLKEACRIVPAARNGKQTHLSTLLRWIERGCKAKDGATVRLEAVRLGSRWMTSREALSRFAAALADEPDEDRPAYPLRAPPAAAP
jgi:hypothetical protein